MLQSDKARLHAKMDSLKVLNKSAFYAVQINTTLAAEVQRAEKALKRLHSIETTMKNVKNEMENSDLCIQKAVTVMVMRIKYIWSRRDHLACLKLDCLERVLTIFQKDNSTRKLAKKDVDNYFAKKGTICSERDEKCFKNITENDVLSFFQTCNGGEDKGIIEKTKEVFAVLNASITLLNDGEKWGSENGIAHVESALQNITKTAETIRQSEKRVLKSVLRSLGQAVCAALTRNCATTLKVLSLRDKVSALESALDESGPVDEYQRKGVIKLQEEEYCKTEYVDYLTNDSPGDDGSFGVSDSPGYFSNGKDNIWNQFFRMLTKRCSVGCSRARGRSNEGGTASLQQNDNLPLETDELDPWTAYETNGNFSRLLESAAELRSSVLEHIGRGRECLKSLRMKRAHFQAKLVERSEYLKWKDEEQQCVPLWRRMLEFIYLN
ncbi:hypothetical protein ERJ75_000483700 [Trypanosoma vivax]|nr:hypothetical protein ERJ75_000483700 [Trypanosoma vivax]